MKPISSPIGDMRDSYEVVVIGSGYGGGISASRLARAGRTVCLLERGREILVGNYPNVPGEAIAQMQFHTPDGHIGSRLGLYDIHVNEQQNVVVGCGLGGTSLINANVALEPEPEVFDLACWPTEIRTDKDRLREGYERAREMLKPTPYPKHYPRLPKLEAHEKSAEALQQPFYRPPINVTFETPANGVNHVGVEQQACTNCGDCVSGCNYGAKNTTLMNYLPDAWNHGAEIFCQAEVRYLEKAPNGEGWIVHFQYLEVGRERFDAPTLFVKAKIVVLSAGTLGSNTIMLRSKQKGLAVSDRVGKDFSGNGDILGFGYDCSQTINGIGFGHHKPGEIPPVGPCITSIIDMRHGDDWRQRMVIEEGSIPGAISPFLASSFALAAGAIGQDTEHGIIDQLKAHERAAESFLLGPYHGAVNNTQTYLIMSHDDGKGQAELNDQGHMIIRWPDVGEEENFIIGNAHLKQATAALGGEYVENPIWTPLFKHSLISVHPLGGCNMGADASQGVVNHKGQVFTGVEAEVHKDLYISDGSVVPTSLAVNPLLTISAITERCCRLMTEDRGWSIDYTLPSAPTRQHRQPKLGIRFTETMKGYFSTQAQTGDDLETYRVAAKMAQAAHSAMEFTLTIFTHDLQQMLDSDDHTAKISGTVICPALSTKPMAVSKGVFNLFERMPSPPDTRHMIYSMQLTSEEGKKFFFKGYKLVKDDPNVLDIWPDTSTLYVSVFEGDNDSQPLIGKGILHIKPTDFAKQMTTMEVTHATSYGQKLEAMAQFGKFFAGVLWESYGGIFYNPDWVKSQAKSKAPRKKRPLRLGAPEVYGITTTDNVNLRLTRYQGGTKGPVMLVHGLGVGSTIFSTDMIKTNLLEYLYVHEYDVWLLDFRVSILLPAAQQQSNGDQIANYDYPAAIAKIREITGADSIQAVVHCYGATTFFMSMLAGLEHVRSIACSQIATNIKVAPITSLKTGLHLPGVIERLGVESLTAKVAADGGSWLDKLYDKALSIYALKEAQGICNNDSCHRITFMYASLYRHETLNDLLHENLDELFAEANIETFEHLALMVRKGEVVNAKGENTYLPHLQRLNLPILFISGAQNICYLPESTEITYNLLRERFDPKQYSREVIPGYGHIDCIFGRNAAKDVFPFILTHLEKTA